MSDIWSTEQARRLFPVIAVAGTLGAVAGPALTRTLVGVIGVAPLLVVSAILLSVALACVVLLGRWARAHGARRNEAGHEDAVGGRSEEHTSELQSLMRLAYAAFGLKTKHNTTPQRR